jgi:hypothetical protein
MKNWKLYNLLPFQLNKISPFTFNYEKCFEDVTLYFYAYLY